MSKTEATAKKVSRIKVKKKTWCRLLAPAIFGQMEMGETYITGPESALGRVLKYNLKDLTGNVKDQNAYVLFRIDRSEGSILHTAVVGYELTPGYVRRLVRKSTTRLDDYFKFVTKDGRTVVVKSVLVTLNKVQRSVGKGLRKQLQSTLQGEISQGDFATFISNIVSGKVRNELKKRLNKIYPLKEIALRSIQLRENEEIVAPPVVEPVAVQAEPVVNEEIPETEEFAAE